MENLRQCVVRDLEWLLNAGNFQQASRFEAKLEHTPHVLDSVLNYGIPDLTGMYVRGMPIRLIEQAIEQAIKAFEPRILPRTLEVTAQGGEDVRGGALRFLIKGEIWGHPLPEELYLRTEVDLGSGNVAVVESDRDEPA